MPSAHRETAQGGLAAIPTGRELEAEISAYRLINVNNNLNQSVTMVKGIGEEMAETLADMNIRSVGDLLEYFPYRYEDYRLKDLAEVKHDEKVTVQGNVHSEPALVYYGRKKNRLTVRLLVGRYLVIATFFNQPYLKQKIKVGETITVTGKWDQHRQTITANEMSLGQHAKSQDFEPVYAVKGKMTVKTIRRLIKLAFSQYGHELTEILPAELLQKYKLLNRRDALRIMHFPAGAEEMKQGRRRFVYEEFLLFQLKMQALRKIEREQTPGIQVSYNLEQLKEFISELPFPLTGAQKRVVNEILGDMKSPTASVSGGSG